MVGMGEDGLHGDAFLENSFLLENLQGGIVYSDYDPPFHLRYATEGMTRLSGYTHDELLRKEQMQLVHEDDVERLTAEVVDQFSRGDTFEVEYRLKRKDGSCVHVLDRAKAVLHDDGKRYIHCMLTDVTELKTMEQALKLSEEKYRLAIQGSGNVVFEWNDDTGEISFSENYRQVFFGEPPEGPLGVLLRDGWIDESSRRHFEALAQAAARSKEPGSMELKVRDGEGRYVWSSLSLTPLADGNGVVHAVVGCLRNIDDAKRRMELLTELSQRDGLTRALNRVAIEAVVNQQVADGGGGALAIVDVDDFKRVNDEYGHDRGDDVLVALADTVRGLLSDEASFARLGGDEFLLFLPEPCSDDEVERFARGIVEEVEAAFAQCTPPITVSLGAVRCGGGRNDFRTLYHAADQALYRTKDNGRNGYTVA